MLCADRDLAPMEDIEAAEEARFDPFKEEASLDAADAKRDPSVITGSLLPFEVDESKLVQLSSEQVCACSMLDIHVLDGTDCQAARGAGS